MDTQASIPGRPQPLRPVSQTRQQRLRPRRPSVRLSTAAARALGARELWVPAVGGGRAGRSGPGGRRFARGHRHAAEDRLEAGTSPRRPERRAARAARAQGPNPLESSQSAPRPVFVSRQGSAPNPGGPPAPGRPGPGSEGPAKWGAGAPHPRVQRQAGSRPLV